MWAQVMLELCSAVKAIHNLGVIHRDLKVCPRIAPVGPGIPRSLGIAHCRAICFSPTPRERTRDQVFWCGGEDTACQKSGRLCTKQVDGLRPSMILLLVPGRIPRKPECRLVSFKTPRLLYRSCLS